MSIFPTKVLLATDGSEMPEIDSEGSVSDPRLVDDALKRAERNLAEQAKTLEHTLGKPLRAQIAIGEPAAMILEAASENQETKTLIAVGSRGLRPFGRLRLGSVSTKLLRLAKDPVLIYPREAV